MTARIRDRSGVDRATLTVSGAVSRVVAMSSADGSTWSATAGAPTAEPLSFKPGELKFFSTINRSCVLRNDILPVDPATDDGIAEGEGLQHQTGVADFV